MGRWRRSGVIWVAACLIGIAWPWLVIQSEDGALVLYAGASALVSDRIAPGREVEWRTDLRNTANEPMTLRVLSASCGCLDVSIDPTVVGPGEHAAVRTVRRAPLRGSAGGWIVVRANRAGLPPADIIVRVRGDVAIPDGVEFAPQELWLASTRKGPTSYRIDVRFVDEGEGGFRLPRHGSPVLVSLPPSWIVAEAGANWRRHRSGREAVGHFTVSIPESLPSTWNWEIRASLPDLDGAVIVVPVRRR